MVGGEFVFPPGIIANKDYHQFSDYGKNIDGYKRYYTFGAYFSSKAIIQNIGFQKGDYVLLPSYLCPTMIYPFKEAGIKYDFYKIREGLLPDLEDIEKKTCKGLKAVLFVDYFGYSYKKYLSGIVSFLRAKGIVTIQDTVQSWIDNEDALFADYCYNSVRKYSPFEASVIFSRGKMTYETTFKPIRKYLLHKRYAQLLRYYHLNYGCFKPERFLKHIEIANNAYHVKGIIGMPESNRWLLDRIDFSAMSRKRKIVFSILKNNLGLKSIVSVDLGNSTPLGMPVYLENRDNKKNMLHKQNIHCPLHWLLSEEIDKNEHAFGWDLQDHALTLPLNVKIQHVPEFISKLNKVVG